MSVSPLQLSVDHPAPIVAQVLQPLATAGLPSAAPLVSPLPTPLPAVSTANPVAGPSSLLACERSFLYLQNLRKSCQMIWMLLWIWRLPGCQWVIVLGLSDQTG